MTGIPYFPQTLPANTVVGRLASGSGPTEAIPLATLEALIEAQIGAGQVLLAKATGTAASYDFVGLTGYKHYLFRLENVLPATSGNVAFWMRVSEDNGATFKAGTSDYHYASAGLRSDTGTANNLTSGGAVAQIVMGNVNSGQQGMSGGVFVPDLTAANFKSLTWLVGSAENGNNTVYSGTGAYVTDANTINGIRFLFASGNIASGSISCYGLSN